MLERIAEGRTDLIFEYLSQGGDARAVVDRASLIVWCAYYGDVSAIRQLLAHGEHLQSLGDNFGLNGAAFHGHWKLCAFLIEHGANPDAVLPGTGENPLHAALSVANRSGNARAASVLLKAGSNPNARTTPGVETGCFMRDALTRGETPLHRAAAFASLAVIHELIAVGARTDIRDAFNETPLAWASWHQRPSAILRALMHDRAIPLHPDAHWTGDHGQGLRAMDDHLAGRL